MNLLIKGFHNYIPRLHLLREAKEIFGLENLIVTRKFCLDLINKGRIEINPDDEMKYRTIFICEEFYDEVSNQPVSPIYVWSGVFINNEQKE